jgi:hypothetical protein
MKRSIVISLLVIGTTVALTLGTGTFAPFTETASDSGTITAGTVNISVAGSGTLDFELVSSTTDCDTIAPGDACDDVVTVTNLSNTGVSITSPTYTEVGNLETCGDGDSLSTVLGALTDPHSNGALFLGVSEAETFTVTTTLEAGANDTCQGESATVTVTVVATGP